MNKNLLVADIGGTHARFHLFKKEGLIPGPHIQYFSQDFRSFEELLERGLVDHPEIFRQDVACFAMPGLVGERKFKVTNLPWIIDRRELLERFNFKELYFLNDIEASVYGVQVLPEEGFAVLQSGEHREGNLAVISPGTGLGEAFLTQSHIAYPTEGGHADFAPVTDLQYEMGLNLKKKLGRLSYEHLLSGSGIHNIYTFLLEKNGEQSLAAVAEGADKASAIWLGAFKYHDHTCIESLRMFVQILAQEAGNLALHTLAKNGIYIGGGIAHFVLPYLQEVTFLDTFCEKGPMTAFLKTVPIKVITDARSALYGCAWYCSHGIH